MDKSWRAAGMLLCLAAGSAVAQPASDTQALRRELEALRADYEARANFDLARSQRFILREQRTFVEAVEGAFCLPLLRWQCKLELGRQQGVSLCPSSSGIERKLRASGSVPTFGHY
jgi:hypothetical protein